MSKPLSLLWVWSQEHRVVNSGKQHGGYKCFVPFAESFSGTAEMQLGGICGGNYRLCVITGQKGEMFAGFFDLIVQFLKGILLLCNQTSGIIWEQMYLYTLADCGNHPTRTKKTRTFCNHGDMEDVTHISITSSFYFYLSLFIVNKWSIKILIFFVPVDSNLFLWHYTVPLYDYYSTLVLFFSSFFATSVTVSSVALNTLLPTLTNVRAPNSGLKYCKKKDMDGCACK